jgi:hypothetical protein
MCHIQRCQQPDVRTIVEQETNVTWKWFVGLLIKDLEINKIGARCIFIFDQLKGLINGMKYYIPCNIPGCEARNRENTGVCIAFMHRKSGKFLRF